MKLTVGTFNLNNLFSRYNFQRRSTRSRRQVGRRSRDSLCTHSVRTPRLKSAATRGGW